MQDNAPPSKAGKARASGPAGREDRLKVALKANMARRKAQAKARASDGADDRAHNDKEDE